MFSGSLKPLKTGYFIIDDMQNILASIFLFSYFVDFMTAPKSISIGLLFIFTLYNFRTMPVIQNFADASKNFKISILSLLVFVCFILFLSFLNSTEYLEDSLKTLQKDMLMPIVFLLWIISFAQKVNYKLIVYSTAVSVCADNIYFTFDEHAVDTLVVSRKYSAIAPMIFPFLLTAIYLIKSNALRIFLIINVLYSIILVAASGARSGYYILLMELFLWFCIFLFNTKRNKKILLSIFTLILLLFTVVLIILSHYSDTFKKSVERHMSSNGRLEIVEHRFPIFVEHGNLLVGFGHADKAYQIFFKKYNAPLDYTNIHDGALQYNSDEPYILRVLYNYGIFGLLLYIWLLFFIGKSAYFAFLRTRDFATLSILISMFSYFLLRGAVENLNLNFVLVLLVIAIAFIQKAENKGAVN